MRNRHPLRKALIAGGLSIGLVSLSACGSESGTDASGDDQIASLVDESGDEAGTEDGEGDSDELSADEAALAFSQCLRDEGLDVADIGVDSDGNIDIRSAFENIDPQDGDLREVIQSCSEFLEGGGFGGAGRGGFGDSTELADAFLEFSDCIREQGFEDVGDLSFQAPGGGGPGGGAPGGGEPGDEPPQFGEGERPEGFGDQNSIFAEALGLDPDDPEVVAALEVCTPLIGDAFGGGFGGPNGNEG